jgi:hypothetical protein
MALVSLLRAAKKNDFTLLQSDGCPEIKEIKHEVPEIMLFAHFI